MAEPDEVHTGPATIRSNVDGDAVREYDIEILKVSAGASDGRELLISVTDPELIAATGGIVQGMSGSPILQDGKFVGAVTHVLLNDPTKGYGILLDTMLSAAQNDA
ncbi:MAG: SpoIVB peptidase S55 domain-containing protein [Dysosmobacter sp.]